MENAKNIIDEYARADLGKRIYLILEHRSLRREFAAIDEKEASNPQLTKSGCCDLSSFFGQYSIEKGL